MLWLNDTNAPCSLKIKTNVIFVFAVGDFVKEVWWKQKKKNKNTDLLQTGSSNKAINLYFQPEDKNFVINNAFPWVQVDVYLKPYSVLCVAPLPKYITFVFKA